MHVIGRPLDSAESGVAGGPGDDSVLCPTGHLGRYLARDGSSGAAVGIDLDRPHAALVVGKRGSGKSHTLGVLAEATARTRGIAPVVVDPMGAFSGLTEPSTGAPVPASRIEAPTIQPDAIPPSDWADLVGLDPESPAGGLVWAAAAAEPSLSDMRSFIGSADAERATRRVAINHLQRASSWEVFDPDGLSARDLLGDGATVLSLSGLPDAPSSAVVAAVARMLYDGRVEDGTGDSAPGRLPWLLVDEAHVALDGVAAGALRTLLTRGRAPGVSLVLATQRPSALPDVAVSQADLLIAHRLTSERDIEALDAARPTFFEGSLAARLPTGLGEALVVDDATETTHTVTVRARETPHGGETPRVSQQARRSE